MDHDALQRVAGIPLFAQISKAHAARAGELDLAFQGKQGAEHVGKAKTSVQATAHGREVAKLGPTISRTAAVKTPLVARAKSACDSSAESGVMAPITKASSLSSIWSKPQADRSMAHGMVRC